jgi:hypothetical protein
MQAKEFLLARIAETRAAVIDFRIKKLPPDLSRLRQKSFKLQFSKRAAASSADKLTKKAQASWAKREDVLPAHAGSSSLHPSYSSHLSVAPSQAPPQI